MSEDLNELIMEARAWDAIASTEMQRLGEEAERTCNYVPRDIRAADHGEAAWELLRRLLSVLDEPGAVKDDERDLARAKALILEWHPGAVEAYFETSDQGSYGFILTDVKLSDGVLLGLRDGDALDRLCDEVWQHVCNLTWNGVMGDDRRGDAVVALVDEVPVPDGPDPDDARDLARSDAEDERLGL